MTSSNSGRTVYVGVTANRGALLEAVSFGGASLLRATAREDAKALRLEAVAQNLGAGVFYRGARSARIEGLGWSLARSAPVASSGLRFRDRRCGLCKAGAPELEEVVGGCDQLPFGLA